MTLSKDCIVCGGAYYKKVNCSKKAWDKSKFCSRDCNTKWFVKAGSDATRGKKLTEEQKKERPNLFQKGHTKHGAKNLKKWREEGGEVWNKGKYGYRITEGERITDLNRLIRTSQKNLIWKKQIKERDKGICQFCGSNENIEIDHIKPFCNIIHEHNIQSFEEAYECNELWDINNGRVLCNECHKKLRIS